MVNDKMEQVIFLVLIVERKQKDAVLTALLNSGIHLIDTIYGKGTVNSSYLTNTFGLVPEKHKALIICVATEKKADIVLDMLVKKFDFNKPNTGIAFTMPVDSLSF